MGPYAVLGSARIFMGYWFPFTIGEGGVFQRAKLHMFRNWIAIRGVGCGRGHAVGDARPGYVDVFHVS